MPQIGNTIQFSDNYSKIIGTPQSEVWRGYALSDVQPVALFRRQRRPCASFLLPPRRTGDDLGYSDAYPDYLLGLGNSYFQGSAQHELVRSTSIYLFAQDSWKIKPNVTLNYGVRWEMNTPLTDIGQKVQTFRPGEVSTIYPCTLPTTSPLYVAGSVTHCDQAGVTPVGLVFPGDKGVPEA